VECRAALNPTWFRAKSAIKSFLFKQPVDLQTNLPEFLLDFDLHRPGRQQVAIDESG
jgi:hypothetical protein